MNLRDAETLAQELLQLHGGEWLEDWTFKFDNAKVRFGYCNYRTNTISLSRHLTELNPELEVRDTILHEIAHALAPRGAHHGPEWKKVAASIGVNPTRCYNSAVVESPEPRWVGTCPKCNQQIKRHRRKRISCGTCSQTFDPRFLFVWCEYDETLRIHVD